MCPQAPYIPKRAAVPGPIVLRPAPFYMRCGFGGGFAGDRLHSRISLRTKMPIAVSTAAYTRPVMRIDSRSHGVIVLKERVKVSLKFSGKSNVHVSWVRFAHCLNSTYGQWRRFYLTWINDPRQPPF